MTSFQGKVLFVGALLCLASFIYANLRIPEILRGGVYTKMTEHYLVQERAIEEFKEEQNEYLSKVSDILLDRYKIHSIMLSQLESYCIK